MKIDNFNARNKKNQCIQWGIEGNLDNNPLWLEDNEEHIWKRASKDGNGSVSHFGAEFLGLCSLHDIVICNGMKAWPTSGGIMCKTYNGRSVVDYVICSEGLIYKLLEFNIEACPIEINSGHMPFCIKLGIHSSGIQEGQTQQGHKKVHENGRILINQEN